MSIKKIFFSNIITASLLAGCSSWFFGDSNLPEPVDLPQVENPTVTTDILWDKNIGAGGKAKGFYLRPTANLSGDVIYAANSKGKILGFNTETGEEIVSINTGNGITSPLLTANNLIFFGTENGDLMAVDTTNGLEVWRQSLDAQLLSAPVLGDNIIVAYASDGGVNAFHPADGTLVWRYHTNAPTLSMHGNASPIIGGGVVIVTTDDGFFIVIDAKTGLPLANNRVVQANGKATAGRLIDQDATPKVNGTTMFGAANDALVYAIDLQSGTQKWENNSISTGHNFAISPTDIYLSTIDGQLIALSQIDGHELWRNKDLLGRLLSPPVAIPGKVGVVDYKGYLNWFDSQTGKLIGQKNIGKVSSNTSPIVLQNAIIWQLQDGHIVAIRPR